MIEEETFRAELKRRLTQIGPLFKSVTGPGRSGAIASAYASHMAGVPFVPYGERIPDKLQPVLIVDTAAKTGRTLRRAARNAGCNSITLAVFNEPPRVRFWYEDAQ